MKTYILSAGVNAAGIEDKEFVKADGSGLVIANTAAASVIGLSNATKTAAQVADGQAKVGVIKKGLVEVPVTTNATYSFGEALELHTDGQTVISGSATLQIGTAAETKTTTTADNSLWVYLAIL